MTKMTKLLVEALVIGLAFGVLGLLISTAMMMTDKKFSFKRYHFWGQVFLSYALTGAAFHLLCEASGVNKWYCRNGHACRS
jgi:hypothetical protein